MLRTELFTMIRNQSKRFLGIIKNTLTALAVRVLLYGKIRIIDPESDESKALIKKLRENYLERRIVFNYVGIFFQNLFENRL